MHKLITLAVAGLAAGWLTLATPSASQAQGISFGLQFQRGGGYYGPSQGCDLGGYDGYGVGYNGYGRGSGFYGGSGYYGGSRFNGGYNGGYGYGRPAIVHPEYRHWTPSRGWHDHGHIHVPHRGHYHTHRY